MSNSWCHVKYLSDNALANVPTSYFKSVVEETLLPCDLKVGSVYEVFWSPDPTETPNSVMKNGNEVISVDDLPLSELLKSKKREQPLKGYFKAALLDLQSREDVASTSTSASKRVRIPSQKIMDAVAERTEKGKHGSSDAKNKKIQMKKEKFLAQEASKASILGMLNKCAPKPPVAQKPQDVSGDSSDNASSTEDEGSSCTDEKDPEYWKKIAMSLMKKQKKRCSKKSKMDKKSEQKKSTKHKHCSSSQKLHHLNKSGPTKVPVSPKNVMTSEVPAEECVAGPSTTTASSSSSIRGDKSSSLGHTHEGEDILDDVLAQDTAGPSMGASAVPSSSSTKDTDEAASHGHYQEAINILEAEAKDDVSYVRKKVKPGKEGDSLFVLNKAAELWHPKHLAIRSVTGLVSNKKRRLGHTKGYPKASLQKVSKIQDSLTQRIKSEEPDVPEVELKKRLDRTTYNLGQKISVVRRALKLKGINIPTAEQVCKAKEESPTFDYTEAAFKIAAEEKTH